MRGHVPAPDPTVIIMRQRRPRGLIITMSVFATLGMVVGGVLFLSYTRKAAETPAPAAGSAAVTASETGAAALQASGAVPEVAPGADHSASAEDPARQDEPANALAEGGAAEPGTDIEAESPEAAVKAVEGEPRDPIAGTEPRRDRDGAPRKTTGAWLALEVEPADATIVVDGVEERSGSPLRVGPLDPGKHTVEIRAPGHEPVERTITLRAGKTEPLRVELRRKARAPARIDVRSTPPGATVLVDGKVRGRTPLRGLRLSPERSYEVALSHDGHEPWQTTIEPAAGKALEIDATLAPVPVPVARTDAETRPEPRAQEPVEEQRDIRVPFNRVGDPGRGKDLFGRCRSCHGSSAPELSPRRYTQRQWTRYLASRRHSRHAALRSSFSVSELADVKAYLLENAADVARGMAAGVR